jgi:endonuclease YncB( thermonuclease family)
MALTTAVVWLVLFMFVEPARGDTVDPRMLYVIDGDTLALAGERIRLLSIDAPVTGAKRKKPARRAGQYCPEKRGVIVGFSDNRPGGAPESVRPGSRT